MIIRNLIKSFLLKLKGGNLGKVKYKFTIKDFIINLITNLFMYVEIQEMQ